MMRYLLVRNLDLPKAELNTKNSTKRRGKASFLEFLVFNSIFLKKSDSACAENRVIEKYIQDALMRI